VNIKIAGKWMFIPLKMVLIGIDPTPCVSSHLPIFVDFVGKFVGKLGHLQEFRGLPLGFDRGIAGWGRVGLWRKNTFFAGCCPVGQGNLRFFHSFLRLLVIDSSFFEYLGK